MGTGHLVGRVYRLGLGHLTYLGKVGLGKEELWRFSFNGVIGESLVSWVCCVDGLTFDLVPDLVAGPEAAGAVQLELDELLVFQLFV